VDIALCASGGNGPVSDSSRGVVFYDLWSEPMVFVCREDHALAGRDRVAPSDLREEMILRFPPGWGVRAIVDGALGDTQSAFEIIDYTLMMRLTRAGFGTTLVPASAVEGERGEGLRAIPFDDPAMRWNLSAAVSADRQLTAAAKTLLAALIQGSR
jgi:DNA-binding transcriptional LysR family regulator